MKMSNKSTKYEVQYLRSILDISRLIGNDKVAKVASSKKRAQFKSRVQKSYPIYDKNG